jgi:hypothetical protein
MKHRRLAVPHSFEDQMAEEKSRLEEQAANLPAGPQKDALLDQRARISCSHERVADIARIAAPDLNRI